MLQALFGGGPDRGEIDRLLDGIRDAMGGYVQDEETTEASATGEFLTFGVR